MNKRIDDIGGAVKNIADFVKERKQSDEVAETREAIQAAAEKAKLPYKWLLAVASTDECSGMPLEDVVPIARKELDNMLGKDKVPAETPPPARAPDTKGTAGTMKHSLTAEDLGAPGSKKFTEETIPKMIEGIMFRQKG